MIRIFLIYVLPLIAPSALYILWCLWQIKRSSGTVEGDVRSVVRRAPWVKLAAIGTGLLVLVLVIAALTGGEPPHEAYSPPHLENGRVVPGEIQRNLP
jgi:heme A synthase